MSAARIEALLFDMGGVLLHESSGYEQAARDPSLCRALHHLGIDDPAGFVIDRAQRVRQAYRKLESECTQPDLDEVLSDCEPAVRRLLLLSFADISNLRPYPQVASLLGRLTRRFGIAIVSNTIIPGDHHRRALELAGVMQHVNAAVWSANFGLRKPHPAIVQHVLGRLGVRPERALLIGDKIRTDVLAAKRAGVRSVHLRRRGTPITDEAVPDFVIRDLPELLTLLRHIS
jgi:HAD superfamily hydrolase (TIGR01509 family)